MLRLRNGARITEELLCIRSRCPVQKELVWRSDNKAAAIESRVGPRGEQVWLLILQRYNNVTRRWQLEYHWLHRARWPFNCAKAGRKTYSWADWADAPEGRRSQLDTRAVSPSELRRIREAAAADKKRAEREAEEKRTEREVPLPLTLTPTPYPRVPQP